MICLFLCCLWVLIFCSCRQKCLDSHMPWTARMTKQNAEYLIESASRFAKKQVRVQRGCRQRYCTKMHKEPLKTFSPLPFPIFVYSLFLFLAVLAWVESLCQAGRVELSVTDGVRMIGQTRQAACCLDCLEQNQDVCH